MTNANIDPTLCSAEQQQRIIAVRESANVLSSRGTASPLSVGDRVPGSVDDIIRLAHYLDTGHTGFGPGGVLMFELPFPFTGAPLPDEAEGVKEDTKPGDDILDFD